MEAMDVHKALTVVKPGSDSIPTSGDVSNSSARRLCNVMAAYRLMDVLYALQQPTTMLNPRHGKLPRKGLVPEAKVCTDSRV